MKIVSESVLLPPREARRLGKGYRRVFYVSHGDRRVGPYARHIDAVIARKRVLQATGVSHGS